MNSIESLSDWEKSEGESRNNSAYTLLYDGCNKVHVAVSLLNSRS